MSRGRFSVSPRGTVSPTPRLVATDLDGTLLRGDLSISARTLAVLDRLTAAGVPIVLVTGRPRRWLPPVLAQTGPRGPVVIANGAAVLDPETLDEVMSWPMPADLVAEVVHRLSAAVPDVMIGAERSDGVVFSDRYPEARLWPGERRVGDAGLVAEPALKLLVRSGSTAPPDAPVPSQVLLDAARAVLDGLVEMTFSDPRGLVEVSAPGITKASGLAWVAERAGVAAADVVAFGDMPNDLPMLHWAGRGVAVANAHPSVLAAADEVTGDHDEDGVAARLEAWTVLAADPPERVGGTVPDQRY